MRMQKETSPGLRGRFTYLQGIPPLRKKGGDGNPGHVNNLTRHNTIRTYKKKKKGGKMLVTLFPG